MMITESASGKLILFGEHAVVYGRPALAVPLSQMRARATVQAQDKSGIVIRARDLKRELSVKDAAADDPLATIVRVTLAALGVTGNLHITVESDIPPASGFGSGAAISTAIVRALAAYFEKTLSRTEISALVYETEKLYHGTPSGIDNSVIAYEEAIRFVRERAPETAGSSRGTARAVIRPFAIARSFPLVIANSGIASPTKMTVGDVRRGWEREPARYEAIFDSIGVIVEAAQMAVARGENEALGDLMTQNQRELERIGVSSPEIEDLLAVGLRAGAQGGKLSGGGRGGNVIFYVEEDRVDEVTRALPGAGAVSVIVTRVGGTTTGD